MTQLQPRDTPSPTNPGRRRTNKRIFAIFGGIAAVIVLIVVIGALAGGGKSTPSYTSSRDRDVITAIVDFDDQADLRKVFDDVVSKHQDLADGGYHVQINCSTGGSASADNRLGNGRFAIGALGAAQVGLKDGASEFKVNEHATCPK